jgi:hypothetical protein
MGESDDGNSRCARVFTNYFHFRCGYSRFSESPVGSTSTSFSVCTFEDNDFSTSTKGFGIARRVIEMHSDDTEFDQFLDFLTHLSTELASGTSPEYALVRTSHYFGNQTPNDIVETLDHIINGTKSFHVAWSDLVENYIDNRNSRLLELLGRFVDKGSVIGGERMLQVIKHVRKNSAMTKNRKNLVSSQRVKVFALSFVSSIVIGMIAAISPLLTLAFYQGVWVSTETYPSSLSFYIVVASFLTVIVTGFRLNQTVGGSSRTLSINLVAFGCTYILISQLLLSLL